MSEVGYGQARQQIIEMVKRILDRTKHLQITEVRKIDCMGSSGKSSYMN